MSSPRASKGNGDGRKSGSPRAPGGPWNGHGGDRALRPEARRANLISRKKPVYPLSDYFAEYLARYRRLATEGADYGSLLRFDNAVTLYDEHGHDTLWNTVLYGPAEQPEIHDALRLTYALLKSDGDLSTVEHLYVDRVDLCLYGNTLPFRVRIVNALNENFDYFYVKKVDANRLYGLELEHVLSPNRINYLVHGTTLIEEHIVGIPADQFIREAMPSNAFDEVRLAKEFVKFNERCFVRLLGDMHSGNFVVDITPDFEKMQYRLRPIDFDQQSHHGKKQVYLPQYFPQNNPIIELGMRHMTPRTVDQYQREERALIAGRIRASHGRYSALMEVMCEDIISDPANVRRLGAQLAAHYDDPLFGDCQTMGELVYASLERLLHHHEPASASMLHGLPVSAP
ncbi:MAG TPA: hypothetical protein VK002_10825 [Rubricoccaceae bacterium]|nr:hypothetical protein [Rubricoccaceae bacterium]